MSFILGGLLSGLGNGMRDQAIWAREDALERLRNQRNIEAEGRKEERAIAAEDRQEKRDIRSDERQFGIKAGLLEIGGNITQETNRQKSEAAVKLEGLKHANDKDLARLNNGLAMARDRANAADDRKFARLQDQLKSDDFGRLMIDGDTNEYVIVMKGGSRSYTGITAPPTAASIEAEDNYARRADIAKRRGEPAPERPSSLRNRNEKKEPTTGNQISREDLSNLYNEASAKAARGEGEWKGLNAAQIKAKVNKMVRANGYSLP